jgi:hypothetical protein
MLKHNLPLPCYFAFVTLLALTLYAVPPVQADLWPASSFAGPNPAIVRIVVQDREGMSLGSGVLIATNEKFGLVLTCWHVVSDAAGPINVYFPGGFRSGATLLRTDRDWDLAALAVWRPNVQPLPLSAQAPRRDDMLIIAGYGGNGTYRAVAGRCTQYVAPDQNFPFELVEVGAAARQGDSGGPILNNRGEVAGILSASGFGATSGTYCGRVRWFLNSADGDFQRLASQTILAEQQRRERPPLAAIPAAPADPAPAASPAAAAPAPTVTAAASQWPPPTTLLAPVSPRPPAEGGSIAGNIPPNRSEAAVAAISSRPTPPGLLPVSDQVRTVLALVGAVALLYHAIKMLGWAIG